MFAVLAAAAEYELEPRAERQAEGIAAAHRRQAGGTMLLGKKHVGRPRVTGPAELAALRQLIRDGTSVTQAARTLKISRLELAFPGSIDPGPRPAVQTLLARPAPGYRQSCERARYRRQCGPCRRRGGGP